MANRRSTACHGLNLVLDLNQKLLKFLVFLSNSYLYLSVFVLEPLLMYSKYCLIVQLVLKFHAYGRLDFSYKSIRFQLFFDSVRIFHFLYVVVLSYVISDNKLYKMFCLGPKCRERNDLQKAKLGFV